MNRLHLSLNAAASVLALCVVSAQSLSAELKLPRDGWVSWQVPAVEGAPAWCCFNSWGKNDAKQMACRLDGGDEGYGMRDGDATTDTVKVYARFANGKTDSLQVFAASCAVQSNTPIQELAGVTPDDSARWLITQAKQPGEDAVAKRPIGEGALAALALHRGDFASDALANFARDPRAEARKWSVFWLAMARGNEGADVVSSVMFNDPDDDVREHAVFALSQSKSPRVTADLIRLGNTDKVGEVRAKAWFWLAQTKAPETEKAIASALRKDSDEDVREEAIVALAQLPDERATKALIAVAEDQSLSREQRKRAVFWLSQSESNSAQAYLEKVLLSSSP